MRTITRERHVKGNLASIEFLEDVSDMQDPLLIRVEDAVINNAEGAPRGAVSSGTFLRDDHRIGNRMDS